MKASERNSTDYLNDIRDALCGDKLIHGYFGVNLKRVWDTVLIDLPPLREVVLRMLENLKVENRVLSP